MQNVIHSFQGMLDSLDWMSQETKRKAYEKTMGIGMLIAEPQQNMISRQRLDVDIDCSERSMPAR